MKKIFTLVLIKIPQIEAIIRNLYWRNSHVYKFINFLKKNKIVNKKKEYIRSDNNDSFLKEFYKKNVNGEKLILLHSSLSGLQDKGIDKNKFVKDFIEKIKYNNVTLIAPTFPIFRNSKKKLERFDIPSFDPEDFIFDINSKRISTGELGKAILNDSEVFRSEIPINNLSSIGPLAPELFKKEKLYCKSPYPCGIYTPWQEIYELDAKIIFFDVDPVHSFTLIHYVEDSYPDKWPVKYWYRERRFKIKSNQKSKYLDSFERDPKWSLSYCESILFSDLIKQNILKYQKINNVDIFSCKSNEFVEFIKFKNSKIKNYPYFMTWLQN